METNITKHNIPLNAFTAKVTDDINFEKYFPKLVKAMSKFDSIVKTKTFTK